ncbi:interleukin-1 receptor-like 1 [Grus japonensis]|uniref:Interleukin-1 receptor-like 1 n=1 Tax=Grus japonensis TaxID=30415 RepID=A0ABC9W093_GRUJA
MGIQMEQDGVGLPNVLLITGSLVLLVAIAVSVILYQSFRVDIVLLYREIFQPCSVKDDGKIYDAYVIYPRSQTNEANFVEYFVYQIMPDILENKCGYKLCIYGRDIYPGEDTASAIEKRMQKSRRLIILLTHQLINCKEPAYDQHIALYNALIQNDTKVILLEMETIGTYDKLQESLRFIIKRQGTVKWKEQHTVHPQSSNSKFWKQVSRFRSQEVSDYKSEGSVLQQRKISHQDGQSINIVLFSLKAREVSTSCFYKVQSCKVYTLCGEKNSRCPVKK